VVARHDHLRRPGGSPSFVLDEPTRMYVHCKVRSTHDIADVGTTTVAAATATATDDDEGHEPPAVWP
jgi:hypothetical protein